MTDLIEPSVVPGFEQAVRNVHLAFEEMMFIVQAQGIFSSILSGDLAAAAEQLGRLSPQDRDRLTRAGHILTSWSFHEPE